MSFIRNLFKKKKKSKFRFIKETGLNGEIHYSTEKDGGFLIGFAFVGGSMSMNEQVARQKFDLIVAGKLLKNVEILEEV